MTPTPEQLAAAEKIDAKWFELQYDGDHQEDAVCAKCEQFMYPAGDRTEPTPMCDECAHSVCESVPALIAQRDEARRFANRWVKAATYATMDTDANGNMHAFDPMSPEAFAESRRHCLDTHLAQRDAAREQARIQREAADKYREAARMNRCAAECASPLNYTATKGLIEQADKVIAVADALRAAANGKKQ